LHSESSASEQLGTEDCVQIVRPYSLAGHSRMPQGLTQLQLFVDSRSQPDVQ
jgi:hypothetical protein